MEIERISIAPGKSVTLPLMTFTGTAKEVRVSEITGTVEVNTDSVTAELTAEGLVVTGVFPGNGRIRLHATPGVTNDIPVTCEYEDTGTRWRISYGGITTSGEVDHPNDPLLLILTGGGDSYDVTLTWSGDGEDRRQAINWGDGRSDVAPAEVLSMDHTYANNGTYVITVIPEPTFPNEYPPATTTADIAVPQPFPPMTLTAIENDPLTAVGWEGDGAEFNQKIDWGDGTVVEWTSGSPADHTYGQDGTYTISVRPVAPNPDDQYLYPAATISVAITNAGGSIGIVPPDAQCFGPYDANGVTFWVCTSTSGAMSLAFDVDEDPDPDVLVALGNVSQTLRRMTPMQRLQILQKMASY